MKRIIPTIVVFSAFALLLASCEKEPMFGGSNTSAIKLTVSGVSTKAKVITDKDKHSETIYDYIETTGFNISAYVTDSWERDVIGHSGTINPGIFVDPGPYNPDGTYDITYPDENYKLKDVRVSYDDSRSDEKWRIAGNEDYANHKFSWVNGVAMNFFAYAPVTGMKGTRTINKGDTSVDANYPFDYSAKAVSDEVTSANCDDLIFAFTQHTATFESNHTSPNYGNLVDGSSDKFNIEFYHAMAQIRFCVDPADFPTTKLVHVKLFGPESSTPSTYLGIPSSGSCTFAGETHTFSWSSLGNRYAYSQTFNGTSGVSFASGAPTGWTESTYDTDKTLYTCVGDVLFVIPQSLSECAVEVCIQEGTSPARVLKGHLPATTSSSPNVSWEAGKYYTYKIGTAGEGEDLSLSMTLVDWAEREHYIPID